MCQGSSIGTLCHIYGEPLNCHQRIALIVANPEMGIDATENQTSRNLYVAMLSTEKEFGKDSSSELVLCFKMLNLTFKLTQSNWNPVSSVQKKCECNVAWC